MDVLGYVTPVKRCMCGRDALLDASRLGGLKVRASVMHGDAVPFLTARLKVSRTLNPTHPLHPDR